VVRFGIKVNGLRQEKDSNWLKLRLSSLIVLGRGDVVSTSRFDASDSFVRDGNRFDIVTIFQISVE
jgi:hypothetical protein